MVTTRTARVGRWTAAKVASAIVAIVLATARASAADPVQPDPLGLIFCDGGSALVTPVGIEPELAPGGCAKTQADDYTVVGGYYDMQCGAAGASSMEQHSAGGYQVATASSATRRTCRTCRRRSTRRST
jgi:hypothetical protein